MSVSAQAKVSFENETRVIHLANTLTYAELLELVKNKFPNAYPCQIKYLDRCADPFLSSLHQYLPWHPPLTEQCVCDAIAQP